MSSLAKTPDSPLSQILGLLTIPQTRALLAKINEIKNKVREKRALVEKVKELVEQLSRVVNNEPLRTRLEEEIKRLQLLIETKTAEIRAGVTILIKELLDSVPLERLKERLVSAIWKTANYFILFTYLPMFFIALAFIIVMAVAGNLNVNQAVLLFFAALLLLFFFSMILLISAGTITNNLQDDLVEELLGLIDKIVNSETTGEKLE